MKETSLTLFLSLLAPLHLPVWKAQRLPQPFNVQQICSKSIHHPSSALRHSSIAFVSYSIILSIMCSFLLFPLFSAKIKNSTPLFVLGKKKEKEKKKIKRGKRDQRYSPTMLHSESKVNSLALGFGPATLYILTSLENTILQSNLAFSHLLLTAA